MYQFQVGTAVYRPPMNTEAEAKREVWRGVFICLNFERSEGSEAYKQKVIRGQVSWFS
jgi:hypothetical protein